GARARPRGADQRALRPPGLRADRASHRAPRRRAGLRALPGLRALLRLEPARRHEPRRQGVRGGARRRAGRARALAVHRRGARAGGGADREPVRHRAVRRGHAPGAHHVARGAAHAHAEHAAARAGVQRLPLGRTHAGRCRAHAPPQARHVPRARRAAALRRRLSQNRLMHRVPPFDAGYAWFLDIDGTLLDIAAVPSAVRARPADTQLLTSLYALSRGALALISGRSIAGIAAIFAPLRLPAAGQHGTERRDARGRERRHPVPEAELRQAAAQLEAFAARHEGLLFEDKGASLAVHYRLAPALGGVVHATMRRLAVRLGPSVEVQSGKLLAELKPAGRNKGHAIEAFLTEP